jgi:hypothetical protein
LEESYVSKSLDADADVEFQPEADDEPPLTIVLSSLPYAAAASVYVS